MLPVPSGCSAMVTTMQRGRYLQSIGNTILWLAAADDLFLILKTVSVLCSFQFLCAPSERQINTEYDAICTA